MGMSNAERQRCYITRLKAKAKATANDEVVALQAQISKLKAKIAELKAKRETAEVGNPPPQVREPEASAGEVRQERLVTRLQFAWPHALSHLHHDAGNIAS